MEKELITGMGTSIDFEENDIVVITISCETKYPQEIINMIKENMQKLSKSNTMNKIHTEEKC